MLRFNPHYELENQHAFLGASKFHWIRYDVEKMRTIWENKFAAMDGVRKHAFAAFAIRERVRVAELNNTLHMYINDAIGFRMTPEQPLKYSDNCFGTPDAIDFRKQILRIHDLKTGVHPGNFDQIRIYCALFCLEYKVNPYDIEMIMRIYQNNQIFEEVADPKEIRRIMDKIVEFDKEIETMKEVLA